MNSTSIDILLPTYNGAKYIRILLDSLLAQTHTDWHLYVRDDNSKDDTVSIVNEYIHQHPGKITLLDNGGVNIGINQGFSTLLQTSNAPYACFCDQDDKWMEDKLEVSLKGIQKLEKKLPNKPCLVYSDLCMVDNEMNVIAKSRWEEDKVKPHYLSLAKLLVQNPINGCVTIMNRKLIDLAKPVHSDALWFDHWVALMAAAAGKIELINRTTIFYRIHEFNASRGENRITKTDEESQLSRKLSNQNFNEYFHKLELQAIAVQNRLKEKGYNDEKSQEVLNDFLSIKKVNPIKRRWIMLKHGIFKHSWLTTIKWLIRV